MATKKFKCKVCGYVHEGDAAPEKCPVCQAPASEFEEIVEAGETDKPAKKGLNTDGNTYTIIYSCVVVVIVAFLLAFVSKALEPQSMANVRIDKKSQILAALNLRDVEKTEVEKTYDEVVVADEIIDKDGNVIVKANHMITPKRAARVIKDGINENGEHYTKVKIRTILTCRSGNGICAKCYGANMATGEAVQVGESVGIIAAQSIGEPGTQLTMRTFHTGGVAGGDITQGLPRVEELFEARKPKGLAIITEIAGVAQIKDTKKKREIVVTNPEDGVSKTYLIPYGSRIKIADGTVLEAGDELTEGSVNPHDILKIKGVRAVQDYMIREVQRVYRLQGVEINDKHIEVIVRQMLKKIRIEENGDTEFLPGDMVDFLDYDETNKALIAEGKEPAEGKQVLLGITKASLASDSFLSAASFQETTKVLTDAAIKGKVDHLVGLKENVIIGKPIPAGTGMKCYSNIHLNTDSMIEEEEDEDLILTEDLEDDAPAAPMAEAPVEEPSAEEEEPMLDFDFEEMIPSKDDTEE